MIMKKYYMGAVHNTVRALEKVGEYTVQTDFDKVITMNEYCKNIKIDSFVNKAQFFNALFRANLV
ncbi:MAG: hypothetical protein MR004_07000 [Clostridiales bacterium]|nr:hypothetical protein [bacterium 210917-SL.2.15]MCI5843375.1 hypothetical protein [Clostridiales bacterium]MDY4036330.1 hypothetical protein [Candidatus Pseudoscilispira sp.]